MKAKKLLPPIAVLSYLLSLPLLATGLWLLWTRDYNCESLLHMPLRLRIAVGVGFLLLFLLNNLVTYFRRIAVPGTLVLVAPLMIMFMLGLLLTGTYKMESRAVPASPMWLQQRVDNYQVWDNIKTCIFDAKICSNLAYRTADLTSYDFSLLKLSPIESGCCKPPVVCGMGYVNATYWTSATKNSGSTGKFAYFGDCKAWNNQHVQLCYDCKTCRQGYLTTISRRWKEIGLFLMLMSLLLLITHAARLVVTMMDKHKA